MAGVATRRADLLPVGIVLGAGVGIFQWVQGSKATLPREIHPTPIKWRVNEGDTRKQRGGEMVEAHEIGAQQR